MRWNTRFNPTVNGPLHVGHVYAIAVNYTEAMASGGKFTLRYDDSQWSWNYHLGPEKVALYKAMMEEDLAWLEIEPVYSSQAGLMERVDDYLEHVFHFDPIRERFACELGTSLAGCDHRFYPYAERLTVEHVLMDMIEQINWVIRGMDMITEDCFYKYFCNLFDLPTPVTSYLPRLYFEGETLSKTAGRYQVREFREKGVTAAEFWKLLKVDCLKAPKVGWRWGNVKRDPVLGEWAREALYG